MKDQIVDFVVDKKKELIKVGGAVVGAVVGVVVVTLLDTKIGTDIPVEEVFDTVVE